MGKCCGIFLRFVFQTFSLDFHNFFFLPLSQWFTTPHLDSFVYFKRITLMPSDNMNSEYVGGNKITTMNKTKITAQRGLTMDIMHTGWLERLGATERKLPQCVLS